ncbi:MAG: Signal transduction histidine kinase [Candidatus Saccharibacteria bacterium]|nr:Signal transduction histidine kinase [Candidatus Saccharibacteria bacterium]
MKHVLLVEPDRVLADTYRRAFIADGYSVTMCASAQSAIFAADEKRPDVVVAELQLIRHSGIEFLYEFRSYDDWHDVPVVINSQVPPSEFSRSWQLLNRELGVEQYYYKPSTTLATLLSAIRRLTNPLPAS